MLRYISSVIFSLILPLLCGLLFSYWVVERHEYFFSHPVLFYVLAAFVMGSGLCSTTLIILLGAYYHGFSSIPFYIIAYGLATLFGRALAMWLNNNRVNFAAQKSDKWKSFENIVHKMEGRSFQLVLLARLSPVLPFAFTNMALGPVAITWKNYVSASLLGMIPRAAVLFYIGFGADNILNTLREPSAQGIAQIATIVLFIVASWLLIRFFKRTLEK